MKKIFYLFSISSLMILLTSCFGELENWYTETAGYDGRYQVAVTCEEYDDDNLAIEDGEELMIYNSAANVANEIIISTHAAGELIRGKFTINGTPADFKSENKAVNVGLGAAISTANLYFGLTAAGALANPPSTKPASAGLELDGIQIYSLISLDQGNITPSGKTTIGGNPSDGVLVELTLYSEYLVYESYETPSDDWANPGIPEFAWRVQADSRENADGWEEHWTFDGYRYTGYPEDIGAPTPIITK